MEFRNQKQILTNSCDEYRSIPIPDDTSPLCLSFHLQCVADFRFWDHLFILLEHTVDENETMKSQGVDLFLKGTVASFDLINAHSHHKTEKRSFDFSLFSFSIQPERARLVRNRADFVCMDFFCSYTTQKNSDRSSHQEENPADLRINLNISPQWMSISIMLHTYKPASNVNFKGATFITMRPKAIKEQLQVSFCVLFFLCHRKLVRAVGIWEIGAHKYWFNEPVVRAQLKGDGVALDEVTWDYNVKIPFLLYLAPGALARATTKRQRQRSTGSVVILGSTTPRRTPVSVTSIFPGVGLLSILLYKVLQEFILISY